MAGRPPKVNHVRDAFLKEINSARALVLAVNQLPRKVRHLIKWEFTQSMLIKLQS